MSYYISFFEIAAFLASSAAWPYIRKSPYLRLFPFLLFIIVVVEVLVEFVLPKNRDINSSIYNVQIPVQHIFYLFILLYSFEKVRNQRLTIVFMVVFVLFTLITTFTLAPPHQLNTYSYCLGSLFLIIGVILKFYEILKNPTQFDFLKNPYFYILFAFLLFNVSTLPYFAMGNWLYFKMGYKNPVNFLINMMSILNYILYTTYTLVFLWIIRAKAYY